MGLLAFCIDYMCDMSRSLNRSSCREFEARKFMTRTAVKTDQDGLRESRKNMDSQAYDVTVADEARVLELMEQFLRYDQYSTGNSIPAEWRTQLGQVEDWKQLRLACYRLGCQSIIRRAPGREALV
eukprot:g73529.t1